MRIPININDNIFDDVVNAIVNSFLHLTLFSLVVFFAKKNNFDLAIICTILFFIIFVVTPGITYFYSNALLHVSKDGFRINKYDKEILFIPFDNLIGIKVKKTEMKSNTVFEISLDYREFQIVDYSTDKTLKFKIEKKNFKSANQYYDAVSDYFKSNLQLPQVWPENI